MLTILYVGESTGSISQLNSHSDIVLIVCSNRQEAANALLNSPLPDAILFEHLLSHGDDIEWHEQLRENKAYDQISFILLAHEFSEELFKTAFLNRIDDFFVLPLPPVDGLFDRLMFLKYYRHKKPASQPEPVRGDTFQMPVEKRIFDLVVAIGLLWILSPILILAAIAIWLESPGQVYYKSVRVGRFGRKFNLYKLRTMRISTVIAMKKAAVSGNQDPSRTQRTHVDYLEPCPRCGNGKDGKWCGEKLNYVNERNNMNIPLCAEWIIQQKKEIPIFKNESPRLNVNSNDLRVTRVGRILQDTGFDQLPQLINVIKGDMSIVGNDPLPLYTASGLTKDPLLKRFFAPAGMISLWQVEERGFGPNLSEQERIGLDNAYADQFLNGTYSVWYDVALIIRRIRK